MDDMPDLNADLEAMEIEALLEYQQSLTRARQAINDKARSTQEMVDQRATEMATKRAAEDARFGQRIKPPTQDLF